MTLWSVGPCPVCPGSCEVVCLRPRATAKLCFFCWLCGCAWHSPPGDTLDEINSIEQLAPTGFDFPDYAEIEDAGLHVRAISSHDLPQYLEFLSRANRS